MQRKFIKLMEDIVFRYDSTARMINGNVIQYSYADNGLHPERQY